MNDRRSRLQFAVLQTGARMHYAIPALLSRSAMLRHFYTDAVGNVGIAATLSSIVPTWMRPGPVRRLMGRQIPAEVPHDQVTTAPVLALYDGLLRSMKGTSVWSEVATEWLRTRMVSDDFHGANALYCLDNGDEDVIREAKRRGMAVVYEQVITPQVGRTMRAERQRFAGMESQDGETLVEEGIAKDLRVWSMADVVLAPSEFVRQGMIELGADPRRIALVPYGLPEHWYAEGTARTIPGRVLFVGQVGLRKGNQYLAEACRLVRDRGVDADFRVVGPHDPIQIASPAFTGPTYVGQVPRAQIREEFGQADVFAFPTLAEGFSLAHLEAMACGVPVVTTPNCGPAVTDGEDGFIVPPRDSRALADRIQSIITDRNLRDRMSDRARIRAAQFSWTNYQEHLLAALSAVNPRADRMSSGHNSARAA